MKKIVVAFVIAGLWSGVVHGAPPASAPKPVAVVSEEIPRKTELRVHAPLFRLSPEEVKWLAVRESVLESAVAGGKCPEWAALAYDIGWPAGAIPRLLSIMHRESRCLPDACSQSDSGRVCRDWGLMQINEYSWKRTITGQGMVMRDMWNPELNLRFALWLYQYSEGSTGCGWTPWAIPGTKAC